MLYFNITNRQTENPNFSSEIVFSKDPENYRCAQRPKFGVFRQNGHFRGFAHLNPRIWRFLKNSVRKQQAGFWREKVPNFGRFLGRF